MEPSTPVLPTQVTPPELALSDAAPHAIVGVEVVAVPVLPGDDDTGPALGPGAEELSEQLGADLLALLEAEKATGKVGEVVRFPVPLGGPTNADLRWVFLVGVGDQGTDALRRAGAALARATVGRSSVATSIASLTDDAGLEAFVVGAVLGSFSFSWRSQERPESAPVARIVLTGCAEDRRPALERGLALGGAGWRARLLATVPSNLKNPPWLAEQARLVAEEAGLAYRVWDEQQLAAEGFGGIIGVGQGSATPPRLVRLDYTPRKANRRTPTVVLVGKGITFDTGGLSIKPAEGMTTMKRDMTGAAVVLSVMAALETVGCPVKVVGLLACAENAVSGSSMRPGDVLRHYGGGLASAINDAGTRSGERMWRFPLASVYEERISSKVADADNAGGGPGAITAALFLQHFTGDVPWAHLDVASVGDSPSESFEWTAGPTGFGARALLTWLGSDEPLAGIGTDA